MILIKGNHFNALHSKWFFVFSLHPITFFTRGEVRKLQCLSCNFYSVPSSFSVTPMLALLFFIFIFSAKASIKLSLFVFSPWFSIPSPIFPFCSPTKLSYMQFPHLSLPDMTCSSNSLICSTFRNSASGWSLHPHTGEISSLIVSGTPWASGKTHKHWRRNGIGCQDPDISKSMFVFYFQSSELQGFREFGRELMLQSSAGFNRNGTLLQEWGGHESEVQIVGCGQGAETSLNK